MDAALLTPLARPRLVGTATRKGDAITFVCTGLDSLDIDIGDRVGIELTRVQTADDALSFVAEHGPLGALPSGLVRTESLFRGRTKLKTAVTLRESVHSVRESALHLSHLLSGALNAKRAADGDPGALEVVKKYAATYGLGEGDLLGVVTAHIGYSLTIGMGSAQVYLRPSGSGRFEFQLISATLLEACFVSVARNLSADARLSTCEECARPFIVTDGRQRFCDPKCASRARFHRFKLNNKPTRPRKARR